MKYFLVKKKCNKEEDKLMNEKAHDEWEEAVSVYNLYNAGCVFLAVCKFGRRHYQAWYAIFSKETLLSIYNINSFINTSIYQISVYQHILHTFWYKQMLDLLGKYLENEIYKSAECNFSSSVYYGN